MKYKWSKRGPALTLLITPRDNCEVALVWRDGDKSRSIYLGSATLDKPLEVYLDTRDLSAVHHLTIRTATHSYTRYIPAKFLNLSSEHD